MPKITRANSIWSGITMDVTKVCKTFYETLLFFLNYSRFLTRWSADLVEGTRRVDDEGAVRCPCRRTISSNGHGRYDDGDDDRRKTTPPEYQYKRGFKKADIVWVWIFTGIANRTASYTPEKYRLGETLFFLKSHMVNFISVPFKSKQQKGAGINILCK